MKYLKNMLLMFFVVDLSMFLLSQFSPSLFVSLLPQFDVESEDNAYPRLVGLLFLMLGLARLYGALCMKEKGAFIVSMWSWAVELVYTASEIFYGNFYLLENLLGLLLAPLMLVWSFRYYKQTFRP